MDVFYATEQSYKNGYRKALEDMKELLVRGYTPEQAFNQLMSAKGLQTYIPTEM